MTLQKNAHYTNTYYQSRCNNAKAGYECDQKVMLYYLAVVVTNCTILKCHTYVIYNITVWHRCDISTALLVTNSYVILHLLLHFCKAWHTAGGKASEATIKKEQWNPLNVFSNLNGIHWIEIKMEIFVGGKVKKCFK